MPELWVGPGGVFGPLLVGELEQASDDDYLCHAVTRLRYHEGSFVKTG